MLINFDSRNLEFLAGLFKAMLRKYCDGVDFHRVNEKKIFHSEIEQFRQLVRIEPDTPKYKTNNE